MSRAERLGQEEALVSVPAARRNAEGLTLDDARREFLARREGELTWRWRRLHGGWLTVSLEAVFCLLAVLVCGAGWLAIVALVVIFLLGCVVEGQLLALVLVFCGVPLSALWLLLTHVVIAWVQRVEGRGQDLWVRLQSLMREIEAIRQRLRDSAVEGENA